MQLSNNSAIGRNLTMPYLISAPDDHDPARERLPLIVFLHGAGERGTDTDLLKCYAIPKQFSQGVSPLFPTLRVLTLSPQCPNGLVWNDLVLFVMDLIDRVAAEYNADPDRISISGLSMGAFGSYSLATAFPDRFSALGMCCGGGMEWRAGRVAHLPVRLYHGKCDGTVPYEHSVSLATALEHSGGKPVLTLYDDLGHNCWDRAYDETDLISWLAAQHR